MNEFTLSGRVNFIDIKYLESGKCFTRVLLSLKERNGEYVSYPITLFNTSKGTTAEDIAEEVKKGDTVEIKGKLTIDKFKSKTGEDVELFKNKRKVTRKDFIQFFKSKTGEDVERIGLIGFEFAKLAWDDRQKKYVKVTSADTNKFSEVEKTPSENMFVNPDLMDY